MSYNNIIEIRNFRPTNTLHCKHLLYILRFFSKFFLFFALPLPETPPKCPPEIPFQTFFLLSPAPSPPALLLIISRPFSRSVPVAFFSIKKYFILLRGNSRGVVLFFPSADVSCPYLRKVTQAFAEGPFLCGEPSAVILPHRNL